MVLETFESLNREKSLEGMDEERKAMKKTKIWELVDLPEVRKAIRSELVFRKKVNLDINNEKLKARLIVEGFNQKKKWCIVWRSV